MSILLTPMINNLKANILNGYDPDAKLAIAAINKEIEYLEEQTCVMRRYADFAKLAGETYTIPVHMATWLDLAVEHDAYEYPPDTTRFKLQYVNVREYNDRTWLVATDGYRLHAYAVELPVGVYLMIDNKLRQVGSVFPDWTTVVPETPEPVAVDEYALLNDASAAWNFLNGNLVKYDPKRIYKLNENYRLRESYFKDALSLGGEPSFALCGITEKHPEAYQRIMMITWPAAFAVIMPMIPER
jgi:hypothetical protein